MEIFSFIGSAELKDWDCVMSDMSQMFDVAESDNMVCWSVITTFTNGGGHKI